jgi:hypothetical protein
MARSARSVAASNPGDTRTIRPEFWRGMSIAQSYAAYIEKISRIFYIYNVYITIIPTKAFLQNKANLKKLALKPQLRNDLR